MREIRKSGSEGGARQTNVSFLPLSAENFSPCLGVSVRVPVFLQQAETAVLPSLRLWVLA